MFSRIDSSAPHVRAATNCGEESDFDDWGEIPTALAGTPRTYGKVVFKRQDGSSESGIWHCTPGTWACHVIEDEFCHFVAGRCTYTHESGESIEIEADTAAFFPKGWTGVCVVRETVRKVYMIR